MCLCKNLMPVITCCRFTHFHSQKFPIDYKIQARIHGLPDIKIKCAYCRSILGNVNKIDLVLFS